MKGLTILGALLIALGLAGLVAGGFSYTKKKETADLGPIDVTVKEKKRISVPTAAAVAAVVGGVVLVVAGTRRSGGST